MKTDLPTLNRMGRPTIHELPKRNPLISNSPQSCYLSGGVPDLELFLYGSTQISGESELTSPLLVDGTDAWNDDQLQTALIEKNTFGTLSQETRLKIDLHRADCERVLESMIAAIRMGNLDTALLLFAGMETRQINEMAQLLVKHMQGIQDRRRELSESLASLPNDASGSKKLMQVQQGMNTLDGDMGIYQQIMKDLLQQKQQALELASTVSQSEHQTAMSILRK